MSANFAHLFLANGCLLRSVSHHIVWLYCRRVVVKRRGEPDDEFLDGDHREPEPQLLPGPDKTVGHVCEQLRRLYHGPGQGAGPDQLLQSRWQDVCKRLLQSNEFLLGNRKAYYYEAMSFSCCTCVLKVTQ